MLFEYGFELINQSFLTDKVSPEELDNLLSAGWRHFGRKFFRYNLAYFEENVELVMPLRIRLSGFKFSKSQRRNLRRNARLETIITEPKITPDIEKLFDRHKKRFKSSIPDSIFDFLSEKPESIPCPARQLTVLDKRKILAVSYFDEGSRAVSGIYAMFDNEFSKLGLGIFTLLREIEYSIKHGKEFYYLGYAYAGKSFYDYKKRFASTEYYDWKGSWKPFANTRNDGNKIEGNQGI
jgi:arginine-tRNA-protein transferase